MTKLSKTAGSHLVRPQNDFRMKDYCLLSEDEALTQLLAAI